ncbi:MAG: DsrH/TusB family sulfur metabolism protein [Pseudomonadota bacterium]
MALHCLIKPLDDASHGALLAQLQKDDAVLFLGAAAILTLDATVTGSLIDLGVRLYTLEHDSAAHGLPAVIPDVQIIDMADWVALTEQHDTQSQWF